MLKSCDLQLGRDVSPWPWRVLKDSTEVLGHDLEAEVLGLGLGNEGQVLGLGLGSGFQGLLKCKSLGKIEVTIKAQVRFLCPLTFKFAYTALHHVLLVAYTYTVQHINSHSSE